MAQKKSELKAWAFEHLKGIENCTFPSFTPDLMDLDEDGIRHDVRQAVAHGFASTLCTCEAGLSFEEAKRFVSIVADEGKGKINVSTTILFDCFEHNVEMLRHARSVGVHGALLGYPTNWYPNDPEEIYARTRDMCEAVPDMGLVVYATHKFNFHRFHPSGFPLDVLDRVLDIPNVVSCKFGLLEPGFVYEGLELCRDRVVAQFPWERWLPLLRRTHNVQFCGAGAYEMFQSPDKPYFVDYMNLLLADKFDEAMAVYWRLTPARLVFEKQFMPTQMIGTYHWPQQKYYQWLVGGNGGYTRQPSMKMFQHEMDECRGALMAIGIQPKTNDDEFFVGLKNHEKGLHVG